jgi:tetratricopeptide (TPR) repeat protein
MRLLGIGIRQWVVLALVSLSGLVVKAQQAPAGDPASRNPHQQTLNQQGLDQQALEQQAAEAYQQSRFEDAARLFRQAVKQRPGWHEGWGYLAASLFILNRYAEARDAYRQTTILTPENGPSWTYLGFCEYELRDYKNAFDHLIKAERIGPGDDAQLRSRLHYELALLWDTAGQFDRAMKEASFLAMAGDRDPPVLEATGLIVLRMPLFPYEIPAAQHDLVMKAGEAGWAMNSQHVEEARQLYKDLVAQNPRQPNLHYAYGFALAVSDQEQAVAELEKELEISPKHVSAMIEAAFLCLEMSQLDKSADLAKRAIEIEPKNYAPHNILGRVLMQTGHSERGIQELETAVRLAPTIASSHFNLAQAYQKAGKSQEAAREFAAFKALDREKEGQNVGTEAHP